MDDLTAMREFHADRAEEDLQARAAAWRALEARFDAVAASEPATPARRGGRVFGRRRLLAFAAATTAAAVVAGALVLGSGPTAQPAAAEILHRTAVVAAASDASAGIPGPGQFLYRKLNRVQLESWIPVGTAGSAEPLGEIGAVMHRPGAFSALVPTKQEWWTAPDGSGRTREVVGTPRFLTAAERRRWESAGSPLPHPFDPAYQAMFKATAYPHALELRRGVVDTENPAPQGFHFPDTSRLPTEPEALRQAVEGNRISVTGFNLMYPGAARLDAEQTKEELINILVEGNPMTPQLRAALFNALAEVPGVEVNTDATDSLGRHGYAIRSVDSKFGGGSEFIFDPDTAEILAQRTFLGDTRREARQNPAVKGLPSGLTTTETDYLETGAVDSTGETPAEAAGGE